MSETSETHGFRLTNQQRADKVNFAFLANAQAVLMSQSMVVECLSPGCFLCVNLHYDLARMVTLVNYGLSCFIWTVEDR